MQLLRFASVLLLNAFLVHESSSATASEKCACDIPQNSVILFDDFQSASDLWATQVFVSKLARGLRSLNDLNRVAVGVFSRLRSSLEDSEFRKDHAFEQAILDMNITPSKTSNLANSLEIVQEILKTVEKDAPPIIFVFVIASSLGSDSDNAAFESKALDIIKNEKYVGYTIGVGENLHAGTLDTLSRSGETWTRNNVHQLATLEPIVDMTMCSSSSGNALQTQSNKTMILFEFNEYKGQSLEIAARKGKCVELRTLPTYYSHTTKRSYDWEQKLGSIWNVRVNCITLFTSRDCTGHGTNFFGGKDFDNPGFKSFIVCEWEQ